MARTEALTFTVRVVVDPTTITNGLAPNDTRSFQTVVADEISSNLESVPYVESVTIRTKARKGENR